MAKRIAIWLLSPYLLLALSWAQAPRRATSTPSAHAQTAEYKGIFEPVNYSHDVNLTDVFFTSVDEGWVSGDHATILHTTDGGKTWTAQVGGDPNNADKPISQLRFLDQKHGWAIAEGPRLLRTLDGQNWQEVNGNFPPGTPVIDYAFTSVRHGILLGGNNGGFYVTNDGGRHWEHVAPCQLNTTIQGLARREDCRVQKLQMLSATSGYALAEWSGGIVFLRTVDAGGHWTGVVPNVTDCCDRDFSFTDFDHGVLLFNNGKTYVTADGGGSWHALLSGSVGLSKSGPTPPLHFADPQVGWVLGASPDNSDTFRVSYSTDSGEHWRMSRNIQFPIAARLADLKFSFPRRDRAYVIGPHGMIYRYRVVPANYSAANTLDAPGMPGFDTAQLTAAASRVRQDITRLQQQIAAASGGTISPPAGTAVSSGGQPSSPTTALPNSPSGGFTQDTSSEGAATQSGTPDASAGAGFTQDPGTMTPTAVQPQPGSPNSGTNTFTQDTGAAAAAFSSDPTNANLMQGFTQSVDTSTPSAPLQSCCGATLQSLQTNLTGFNQGAATNSTQFRSLNLIIAGVQFVSNLLNQTNQLRASFTALKRAPTLQAASAALQQLAATMNSTQQSVSTGFQNQGGWFSANAPAAFVQDVGTGTAGSAAVPGNASSGAPQSGAASAAIPDQSDAQGQSSGTNQQQNPAPSAVDQTMDKAKQKIKNKLKWP